jgi:hypothetical protein
MVLVNVQRCDITHTLCTPELAYFIVAQIKQFQLWQRADAFGQRGQHVAIDAQLGQLRAVATT